MADLKLNVDSKGQDKSNEPSKDGSSSKVESPINKNEDLEAEYTENKKIVIAAVARVSAYRAINSLAIGKPKTVIGSSIGSTRKLMANKGEIEAYYPELVSMSSNNPEFITAVKRYLSNIQIIVDGEKTLDASFVYHHKRDYLEIKAKLDAVNKKYEASEQTEKDATLRNDEINRIEVIL